MTGVGPLEILIVVAIAALLFGAPVVTFIVGYGLGQRKAAAEKDSTVAEAPADEETRTDG